MRLDTWLLPILAAGALALATPGCGKKAPEPSTPVEQTTAPAPEPDTATAPEPDTAPAVAADAAPAAAPDAPQAVETDAAAAAPAADEYVSFDVMHHDVAKGMVHGVFEHFEVVKANIDLTKPETAMAVIAIDLDSLETGIPKRNNHVKSGDFFDVAGFAKATLTVDGVKAAADADTYDANATLDLHGVKKSFPVTFKVVAKKDDGSIVIEGEYKGLARADFNVGGPPEATNVAPTIDSVKIRLHLTNKS